MYPKKVIYHMKKTALVFVISLGVFVALVLLFNPRSAIASGKASDANPAKVLPDSIQKFVQKACMDCHSDDGSGMARSKVNFSKWDSYDAEKQAKKANAMSKELAKSGMPPKKWRANNPDGVPTPADVDMVARWAKSLKK
jgi:cytochrome c553